jgi:biopolymer transport protein TolR
MKRLLEVCLFALAFPTNLAPSAAVQSVAAATQLSSFAGTWKGRMNDLPGIDLKIQEAERQISGDIVFYFQERADINSPRRVTAEHAVLLLKPRIAGKTLTFEVKHHVCHDCAELGPNVTFRMELAGANEARLTRFEEDGTEGTQMKLVRGNEASMQAAPPLQKGISVQMPVTSNAAPMPDADQEDALIVTVTGDGSVCLGVSPIDLDALAREVKARLSNRSEKELYVKADARAPYANVVRVLDVATAAGIERTVLLTSPHESPQPGTVAPANGFTIVNSGFLATARPR